ncbi:MAG TPA: SRPBCC family protein [Flavisolibacter sp.]|jgi:ligand-binding SRPBCC domain-containing protein|nr:SRPBCC family protein [Flavisolibacter sp.]
MGKVYRLYSRQLVPARLEEVWAFFSNAKNLLAVTPPQLNLKVTNEVYGQSVYAGQVMTYNVTPLLGIPLGWMTEITHVHPPHYFVDEQRKGPYKIWHHEHHFNELEGGVEMIDLVHYRLPLGFLGNIANSLLVKKELEKIFTYRYAKIEELFGNREGGRMELQIN